MTQHVSILGASFVPDASPTCIIFLSSIDPDIGRCNKHCTDLLSLPHFSKCGYSFRLRGSERGVGILCRPAAIQPSELELPNVVEEKRIRAVQYLHHTRLLIIGLPASTVPLKNSALSVSRRV